jgi:hypothetical protein
MHSDCHVVLINANKKTFVRLTSFNYFLASQTDHLLLSLFEVSDGFMCVLHILSKGTFELEQTRHILLFQCFRYTVAISETSNV